MAESDFCEFPPGMDPHIMAQLQHFSQRTGAENFGKLGHDNQMGQFLLTLVSTHSGHLVEIYTSLCNTI